MIDINKIKTAIINKKIRFRQHSAEMMIERGISRKEVFNCIIDGEVIEEYINDKPFPSCLFFHYDGKKPVHVVCSYNNIDDFTVIITVYSPDNDHFENDFKTRRKKHEQ